jgi:hypothetical protein
LVAMFSLLQETVFPANPETGHYLKTGGHSLCHRANLPAGMADPQCGGRGPNRLMKKANLRRCDLGYARTPNDNR